MFMYRWIQHDKYIVTECWSMKLEHFLTTLCEFIKISHSDSRVYREKMEKPCESLMQEAKKKWKANVQDMQQGNCGTTNVILHLELTL